MTSRLLHSKGRMSRMVCTIGANPAEYLCAEMLLVVCSFSWESKICWVISLNKVKKTLFNGYFAGKTDWALRRNYLRLMSKQRSDLYNVDVKSEVQAKLKIICWRSTKLWIALKRAQEDSFETLFQEPVDAHKWRCHWYGCSFMITFISLSAVPNMIHFMYFTLGLGQTSNISGDKSNLVS